MTWRGVGAQGRPSRDQPAEIRPVPDDEQLIERGACAAPSDSVDDPVSPLPDRHLGNHLEASARDRDLALLVAATTTTATPPRPIASCPHRRSTPGFPSRKSQRNRRPELPRSARLRRWSDALIPPLGGGAPPLQLRSQHGRAQQQPWQRKGPRLPDSAARAARRLTGPVSFRLATGPAAAPAARSCAESRSPGIAVPCVGAPSGPGLGTRNRSSRSIRIGGRP